jgi:hypothetical protein
MRARLDRLGSAARLALFGAVLALVGGVAAALGSASGLEPDTAAPAVMAMAEHGQAGPEASGLATAAAGYSFEPDRTSFAPGRSTLRFRIAGPDGTPARDFDVEGGVRLHLIVVRRDLSGYRHLHPAIQADGSWTTSLSFDEPGAYRAFADFEVDGRKIVLGRDLLVAGSSTPRALPSVSRIARSGGYAVALAGGPLRAGRSSTLLFTVTHDGRDVGAFQDYVGMRGHLIALREGDLAYTHIHALDEQARGRIDFGAELAEPGRYRLFLQFKVGGRVQTAPFTVEVAR